MSFYSNVGPDEKTRLLFAPINTNVIPFPTIRTPVPPPHDSPISYHGSPTLTLLPLPITDNYNTVPRPRLRNHLSWGFFQAFTSASVSFLGWDMIAGCVLYDPNPLYAIKRVCSSSTCGGILFSILIAFLSTMTLLHVQSQPSHPHPHRVFYTILFLGPTASFLLGTLGAFVALGDMGPQGIAVLHVLSALCACFGIYTAVVSNMLD